MARLTKEELKKVMDKYKVNTLWSWSKIDTFLTSPYEYYLKYVLHKKEDKDNCSYATLGSITHNTIEDFYSGKIEYHEMIEQFEDGWLTAIDIANLKFDRNDEDKNKSISQKYKENLIHFFKNHIPIKHKIGLEKFITADINGNVLQGYIDAIYKDDEGFYNIIDWKTSTKFTGKTLEEKSGQLCVYCIGLMQSGVPFEKIKTGFNFLKYCTIQYKQKNGTVKTRDTERCKIGESLQSNAKLWLKEFGYADEIDHYLKLLLDENSIEVLPKEVQEMYVVSDCYVYIPLSKELIDKWKEVIVTTIKDITLREDDFKLTKNEKIFWDSEENIKKQSYYFATLCGYSCNLHKPYKEYLDKLEASKNEDIFGVNITAKKSVDLQKNKNKEVDLSWLDII